jgi:sulfite reductase alpha subunit-like flavoprotein
MASLPYAHELQILYGSETGTAEDVAFKLFAVIRRLNVPCTIACTDEYSMDKLPTEKIVLFVVSTTGDGEVPSNMMKFWKFLLRCSICKLQTKSLTNEHRKSLPSNSLVQTNFGVFGLGDSGYDKFNAVARCVILPQ